MPFDVAGWQNTPKIAELDLSKPSLPALAYLLRNRHLWPEGFTWNYGQGDHCAMGLGRKVWGEGFYDWRINLPLEAEQKIFWFAGYLSSDFWVTPNRVARVIDRLVEGWCYAI